MSMHYVIDLPPNSEAFLRLKPYYHTLTAVDLNTSATLHRGVDGLYRTYEGQLPEMAAALQDVRPVVRRHIYKWLRSNTSAPWRPGLRMPLEPVMVYPPPADYLASYAPAPWATQCLCLVNLIPTLRFADAGDAALFRLTYL